MANSLSSTPTIPLFYASFQATKQQPNPHKTLSFPFNLSSKTHNLVSLSIPQKYPLFSYTHAFKCFAFAPNEPIFSMEEDGETEQTGSKKKRESMETLIRLYKEAVLAGDYHTIAEIETTFYRLENEKNDFVEKFSTMSEEITAGKERYIRLQADFDNFRKRSENERLLVRSNAQGEVIESLLPMVDNFERAKQQIKPQTDREKQIDTSYQGIYKQFIEIMKSLRVCIVATVGKPFDPSFHEAIAREESEEYKEGIVCQEFRRGFILGDRLLRPAMVKVSSGPGKKKDAYNRFSSKEHPASAASVYDL